jgi:hypothetical protein
MKSPCALARARFGGRDVMRRLNDAIEEISQVAVEEFF